VGYQKCGVLYFGIQLLACRAISASAELLVVNLCEMPPMIHLVAVWSDADWLLNHFFIVYFSLSAKSSV